MILTKEIHTEILRLTLEGLDDKQIAKKIKVRGVNKNKLVQGRTKGLLPKRKKVLGFIILHTLIRIGSKFEASDHTHLSLEFVVKALNNLEVSTPTNRAWTTENLKRFFQQNGIQYNKKDVPSAQLSGAISYSLYDIAICDDTLDEESFIPSVESISLGIPAVPRGTNLTNRKSRLKDAIEVAIDHGAETIAQITTHLNELGYKNAAGKPFSRWSVKVLMQDVGLDCLEKVDARRYRVLMEDWIKTRPTTEPITKNQFLAKLQEYKESDKLFMYVSALYSDLSGLVGEHNKEYRDRIRGEEYREKVEHAVYVKYRHRPVTAEEMAEELGLSPMQANRVMREYLRIDPFDIWYENLYTLVKEYVDENPSFRIEDLAKYLQGTYLSTQRGSVWDYVNTHTTYLRLQARYPDLPNSIGRRQ